MLSFIFPKIEKKNTEFTVKMGVVRVYIICAYNK